MDYSTLSHALKCYLERDEWCMVTTMAIWLKTVSQWLVKFHGRDLLRASLSEKAMRVGL